MSLDRIKDTIAKLLNLARNDAAFEGEVNNAIQAARKLMLKYQLSEEDCIEQELSPEERVARAECSLDSTFSAGPNMSLWEGQLAMFVCKFVGGVKVFRQTGQPRRVNGVVPSGKSPTAVKFNFYGLNDDVRFARQTFEELAILVASMARLKWGGAARGPGRSYAEAFVVGLFDQIAKADAEVAVSDSRALVVRRDALVVAKEKRADLYLKQTQNVKLRASSRRGNRQHSEAYHEGRADGQAADVSGRAARIGGNGEQRRLS